MTRAQRLIRLGVGALVALGIASATLVIVHAQDGGPYNSNPPFCRSESPANLLWWWYECYYPDPPDWGKV